MAATNYLKEARSYAEGGAMSAPDPAAQGGGAGPTPAQGGSGGGAPAPGGASADPGAQLQDMVSQYAQSKDPQLAVAIADALVQLMSQQGDPAQGGGGMPAPGGAGAPAPGQGAPMAAKGMKFMPKKGGAPDTGKKPAFLVNAQKAAEAKGGKPAAKPMTAVQKMQAKKAGK